MDGQALDGIAGGFQKLLKTTVLAEQLRRACLLNVQPHTELPAFEGQFHIDSPEVCGGERERDCLQRLSAVERRLLGIGESLAGLRGRNRALNSRNDLLRRRRRRGPVCREGKGLGKARRLGWGWRRPGSLIAVRVTVRS